MATLGVYDLGPLGKLLARRLAATGVTVAVADAQATVATAFAAEQAGKPIAAHAAVSELVAALPQPRTIVVCTETGPQVDAALDALAPHLGSGDVVVHAGNERHEATARRVSRLAENGITLVGLGVGLGPEVARVGSTLMLGGTAEACAALRSLLAPLTPPLADGPSIDRVGPAPAAHFVKVALMGFEYAEMHLIAEVAEVLRSGKLSNDEIASAFEAWNAAELESLFVNATSRIFKKVDEATGRSVVDLIVDTSGMKPMGQWVVQSALELGSPMPTLAAALASRMVMALRTQRQVAATTLGDLAIDDDEGAADSLVAAARGGLHAAKLICAAETFAMLAAASAAWRWDIPLAKVARLWRTGSTIRSPMFASIERAYTRDPDSISALIDPDIAAELVASQRGLRRLVARAVQAGVAVPTLSAALGYLDSIRRARLPADIIQAQRDFVGASKYQRTDRDGEFHTDW